LSDKVVRHPEFGFYNWTPDEEVDAETGPLGISGMAAQSITGRGVLLDVARHLER
jgi:hypothetical protein